MSTIIRGSGDTTFGGTIQSTGIDDNATSNVITIASNKRVNLEADSNKFGLLFKYDASTNGCYLGAPSVDAFTISSSGGAERMRIDSAGNVLVGRTTNNWTTAKGITAQENGALIATRSGAEPILCNRLASDGDVASFWKDGVKNGIIGIYSGGIYIGTISGSDACLGFRSNTVVPAATNGSDRDNVIDLGYSGSRFDDIYATNGTIQTSDRNEKQDIEELSEAEQRVAVACKGLLRKFRWIDSVEEKGDDARIHFGIIAQDLQDAFAAEGLDAGRYAMFISTTWYEKEVEVPAVEAVEAVEATYDDEGAELTPAVEAVEAKDAYTRTDTEDEPTDGYTERTRLGVRYPELLAFIISAI